MSTPDGPPPPYDPYGQGGQNQGGQNEGRNQGQQPDQGPVIYPPPGTQPGGGQPGQGWGTAPQGGYAPPPQDPYAHLRRDHPKATTSLVLGIVGLVLCGIAAPFAWSYGKKAMNEIDASQGILGGRGQAQAGYILGIIGTVLLVIGLLAGFLIVIFAIIGASTASVSS